MRSVALQATACNRVVMMGLFKDGLVNLVTGPALGIGLTGQERDIVRLVWVMTTLAALLQRRVDEFFLEVTLFMAAKAGLFRGLFQELWIF